MVYTGDTSYFQGLVDFCLHTDLLICEASYSDKSVEKARKWGHMTPKMVSRLINETNAKNVVLTHFVEIEGAEFVYQVKKHVKPSVNVVAAYEGLLIEDFKL